MNEKQAFAKRFIEAIETAGYEPRPSVVEQHFNQRYWGSSVTFQGVRRWLKGESLPEQDKLVVLAEWLGVEPHELRYGVPSAKGDGQDKPWYVGLSVEEHDLITSLLKLPADKKKIVREVILSFAAEADTAE